MSKTQITPLPVFELMDFVPYRITVVAQIMSEGLAREYREKFGISIPQWRVLLHLAYAGGNVSVREIENRVAMEKSKVSRAATKLEQSGYIEKCVNPDDRRLIKLSLSGKGTQLMSELLPLAKAYQNEIENTLGRKYTTFMECIELLSNATGQTEK